MYNTVVEISSSFCGDMANPHIIIGKKGDLGLKLVIQCIYSSLCLLYVLEPRC